MGAVVVDGGELLLVRRGRGTATGRWSVPGGRVEFGETLAAAVVRELAEETGLAGACGPFLGWVERHGPDHHYVILDFLVTVADRSTARAGDDAAEIAWVALADLAHHAGLVDGLVDFLSSCGVLSDPSTGAPASRRTPSTPPAGPRSASSSPSPRW